MRRSITGAGSAASSPMDLTDLPALEPAFAGARTNAADALTAPRVPPISPSSRSEHSAAAAAAETGSVASSESARRRASPITHAPPLDTFAVSIAHLKSTFAAGPPPPHVIEEGAKRIEDLMRECTKEVYREELLILLPDLIKQHPLLCTVLVMRHGNFLKSCKKWSEQFANALTNPGWDASKPRGLLVQLLEFLVQLPSTAVLQDSLVAHAAHPTFNPPPAYLHHDPRDTRQMFLALAACLAPNGSVVSYLQRPECRLSHAMKQSVLDTISVIVRHWKQFDARAWWAKCEAQTSLQAASSIGSTSSSSSSAASSSPHLMLDTQSPAASPSHVLLSPTASDAEDSFAASGFGGVDAARIDGPMHLSHPPHSVGSVSAASASSPATKKPRRANPNLPTINAKWKADAVVISSDEEDAMAEQEAEMYKRPISPRAASQAAAAAAAAAAGAAPPQPAGSKRKRVDMNTAENTVRRYDPLSFSFFDDEQFKLRSILKGSASTIMSPPRARLSKSVSDSAVECRAAAAPASLIPARYAHSDYATVYRNLLTLSPLPFSVASQIFGGFIPDLRMCLPGSTGRGGLSYTEFTRSFTQGIFPCLALHPEGHQWLPHWSLLFAQLSRIADQHSHAVSTKGRAPQLSLPHMLARILDPLKGHHWTDELVANRPVEFAAILEIAKGNLSYEAAAAATTAATAAAAADATMGAANAASAAAFSAAAAASSSSAAAASPRTANGATIPAAAAPAPSFVTAYAAAAGLSEPHSPVPQFGPQDHDDEPMVRGRKRDRSRRT